MMFLCLIHVRAIGKLIQSSTIRRHWAVADAMIGFTSWQEISRYQWNQSAMCDFPALRFMKCCSPDFVIDYYPDKNARSETPIINDISNIVYDHVCSISEESCQPVIWSKIMN
jgi:hypothetical protein